MRYKTMQILTDEARQYFLAHGGFDLTSDFMNNHRVVRNTAGPYKEVDDFNDLICHYCSAQDKVPAIIRKAITGWTRYSGSWPTTRTVIPGCETVFEPRMAPTIREALVRFWGGTPIPDRLEDAFLQNEEAFMKCLKWLGSGHVYDPDTTVRYKEGLTWQEILDQFHAAVPDLAEYQECSLDFAERNGGTTLVLFAKGKPIRKLHLIGIGGHDMAIAGTVFSYIAKLRDAKTSA